MLSGMTSTPGEALHRLEPLVGLWSLEAVFPGQPRSDLRGQLTFEWLPGGGFLVQRWEVPIPEAPDGIAVIGWHAERGTFLQHYFDNRGVARVYEMGFADGVWTLSRSEADFSPLDFRQRWRGTLEGDQIIGVWEICHDGNTWEHDFELRYVRL
jgi:hypothetical protein